MIFDWTFRVTDIVMILAVIFGPVFAVLVTLWCQQRKENRDSKIRLFLTLMAFQKSYPINHESANQLNLIDLVFSDNTKVLGFWHEYYSLLNRQNPSALQLEEQNHKFLELLSSMAADTGFHRLQQTDIDKFYIPSAHVSQANLNWGCQNEFLRVLKNTAKLNTVNVTKEKNNRATTLQCL
jgi:hypothetical protein